MKQLHTADDLFKSVKQIKELFMNDMAAYESGAPINNSPSNYVDILKQLNIILNSLALSIEGFDNDILRLQTLSARLENPDNFSQFSSLYSDLLNTLLLKVIQYREYYCIIKRNDSVPGLASHIMTNLGQIAAAISEGYLPVIDTVNVDNFFTDLSRQMEQNAWELFFRQPFDNRLESVPEDHRCIVKDGIPAFMPSYNMDFLTNPELIHSWKQLFQTYMPFSAAMEEQIKSTLDHIPSFDRSRLLGVLCRGTDYSGIRPYNHPVQPTTDEVMEKAKEVMKLHQCDHLYLATEDSNILSSFKKQFGERLITTQNIYYSEVSTINLTIVNKRTGMDLYQKNMEYLTSLYILSQCSCFIGGRTSGTVVSLLLSKHFDYFYVWNKGRYGIDDAFKQTDILFTGRTV